MASILAIPFKQTTDDDDDDDVDAVCSYALEE